MIETWQLLLFGGCLGTVVANIAVMLLVAWRLYCQQQRARRVIPLPRIGQEDVSKVIEAMANAGFCFLTMRETATGIYTIWFQER